jgi:hypothetical protein
MRRTMLLPGTARHMPEGTFGQHDFRRGKTSLPRQTSLIGLVVVVAREVCELLRRVGLEESRVWWKPLNDGT